MLPNWLKYDLRERRERFQEHLRSLGLRGVVNEHPSAVMAVTAGSALLLLVVLVFQLLPNKPPPIRAIEKEWYYDLNTGKLFVADSGLSPPIEAPSGPLPVGGPAGVRAYVLAYVDEPNDSERFIAFLETPAGREPRDRRPASQPRANAADDWAKGKLIRRLSDKNWVPADSTEGQRILSEAFAPNADGEEPSYCPPE